MIFLHGYTIFLEDVLDVSANLLSLDLDNIHNPTIPPRYKSAILLCKEIR